jgi:hypothetical protein
MKRFSLQIEQVNLCFKKFYEIDSWAHCYKTNENCEIMIIFSLTSVIVELWGILILKPYKNSKHMPDPCNPSGP